MNSVAVIVCTCNRAEHLRRCLDRLSHQNRPPDELIVVQSGSDQTEETLFSAYPGLRFLRVDEDNIGKARNAGIENSRSRFVLFIDDDAEAPADWVEKMASALDGENTGAVGGSVIDGNSPDQHYEFRNGVIDTFGRQIAVRETTDALSPRFHPNVKGCNCGFRREALAAVGNFDEYIVFSFDESDVILSMLQRGWRVRHIDTPVVHYSATGVYRKRSITEKNWYVEIRSQTYFAMKHTPGVSLRFRAKLRVRLRIWKIRLATSLRFLRGECTFRRYREINRELRRGFRDGIRRIADARP